MATVYKPSGRTIYRIEFKDQHGVTRKISSAMTDKRSAEGLADKIEQDAQRVRAGLEPLFRDITGPYLNLSLAGRSWAEFRADYTTRVLAGLAPRTRAEANQSLDHFSRIMKPKCVAEVLTRTVDEFIARRREEPGKKKGQCVSPATINKDLRHLKAALRVAAEWGYLPAAPKVRMQREPEKLPRYVPPDHLAAIYRTCASARWPEGQPYPPAAWWRALTVFIYLTGWRIGAVLAIRRADLDLAEGVVISRPADNKGKREQRVPLHPLAVAHLQALTADAAQVFPWNHDRRSLDTEWHRLQALAGIELPCREEHAHTDACHRYGFHDLRRAFATLNAARLSAEQLQGLMQHQDYQTTQRYIAMAPQMEGVTARLYVPPLPEVGEGPAGGVRNEEVSA